MSIARFPWAQQNADLGAMLNDVQWSTITLHLTKVPFPQTPVPHLAALLAAESSFGGYAPFGAAPNFPFFYPAGAMSQTVVLFSSDGTLPSENAYNFFATDGGSAILLFAGVIDGAPWPFVKAFDSLQLCLGCSLNGGIAVSTFSL